MLHMPANASAVGTLIGIDPGTTYLGVAVMKFDVVTLQVLSINAYTLRGDKLGKDTWHTAVHGERLGRIEGLKEQLLFIFRQEQPLEIISESPFYNALQPSAYGPLVETLCAIRQAVMLYDVWRPLQLATPTEVKQAVGASKKVEKGKSKDLVKEKVLELLSTLYYAGTTPPERLSDHAIDAIAVVWSWYRKLWEARC